MVMENHCKDCKKRNIECHTTCEEYILFSEWCRQQRQRRNEDAKTKAALDHLEFRRVKRQ